MRKEHSSVCYVRCLVDGHEALPLAQPQDALSRIESSLQFVPPAARAIVGRELFELALRHVQALASLQPRVG